MRRTATRLHKKNVLYRADTYRGPLDEQLLLKKRKVKNIKYVSDVQKRTIHKKQRKPKRHEEQYISSCGAERPGGGIEIGRDEIAGNGWDNTSKKSKYLLEKDSG